MGGAHAGPLYAVAGAARRRDLRGRPQNRTGAGALSCMVVHVNSIELHFETEAARVWQVIDPFTESLLDAGESSDPDVRVELPEGDGAYRVQVNDRGRVTF